MLIKVYLPDGAAFAGEKLTCIITFSNDVKQRSTHKGLLRKPSAFEDRSLKRNTSTVFESAKTVSTIGDTLECSESDTSSIPEYPIQKPKSISKQRSIVKLPKTSSPTIMESQEEDKGITAFLRRSVSIQSFKSVASYFIPNESKLSIKIPHSPTLESDQVGYCFAQMSGYFSVDGAYIKAHAFEPLKHLKMYKVSGVEGGFGGGGSLMNQSNHGDFGKYPVYSTAPTLLFYDLELQPGESKSFKFEIDLPVMLPPTHRGRVIRFSYRLVISVHRKNGPQIIQVPFRLFNKVDANATKFIYDIFSPCIINTDSANVKEQPISECKTNTENDQFLISSFNNIEMICQTCKKVTFDICKNNEPVAQLCLLRSVYKLGESVQGILIFSEDSSILCYQVSAFLETVETVELPFSVRSKHQTQRHTRRIHSQQHKMVLNAKRAVINLGIPLTGTPDFQTNLLQFNWSLRVEFITGIKERIMQATVVAGTSLEDSVPQMEDFVHYDGLSEAEVEAFDCVIPLKVFGSRKGAENYRMVFDV